MCVDGDQNPRFEVFSQVNASLHAQGLWHWTYYAATMIRFVAGAGPQRQVSLTRFPMRLDTGAFVSAIPQRWVPLLPGFLTLSSSNVSFGTAGGPGAGRMAPGAAILFPDDPCRDYSLDFLVTPGWDQRNYGLLSLRDIIRHFAIESRGSHQLDPDGGLMSSPHSN